MQFNSFIFLAFFVCVVLAHSLPLPWVVRKFNLLVASYVFYAAWNPWFTLLLLFATVINWLAAKLMSSWNQCPVRRRVVLWVSIVLNIGLVCVFKYGNEFLNAWHWLSDQLGVAYEPIETRILLPVGLSFFTFQALSYTIDIYRRTIKPANSALDFALFVSFFPVLLAGPLLRAGAFLPQCAHPRRATPNQFGFGMALFALGLFLKVILADQLLAPVARQVFEVNVQPDTMSAWVGTVAFAGQDYCDFSGYATCAMGIGLCLGFTVPENFRAPFASVGFRDLWQRWHITLVAWMRDYVFFSLGGVYRGYRRAALNVLIVFLLIGLWHGASLTYVIFGLLHGCYIIVETILQRASIRRLRIWNGAIGTLLLWLVTMVLCCIAFVFYRSDSLRQSWDIVSAMTGMARGSHRFSLANSDILVVTLVVECVIIAHWLRRNLSLEEVVTRVPWPITAICLALILSAIALSSGDSQSYLYFNY